MARLLAVFALLAVIAASTAHNEKGKLCRMLLLNKLTPFCSFFLSTAEENRLSFRTILLIHRISGYINTAMDYIHSIYHYFRPYRPPPPPPPSTEFPRVFTVATPPYTEVSFATVAPSPGTVPPSGTAPPSGTVPPSGTAPPSGTVPPSGTAPPSGTVAPPSSTTPPSGTEETEVPTSGGTVSEVTTESGGTEVTPVPVVTESTMETFATTPVATVVATPAQRRLSLSKAQMQTMLKQAVLELEDEVMMELLRRQQQQKTH